MCKIEFSKDSSLGHIFTKPKQKSLNRICKDLFNRKTPEINIVALAKTHLLLSLKLAEIRTRAEIEGAEHEKLPFFTLTSDAPDKTSF